MVGHLNIGQVKLEKGPRPTRWTKDAHIVHQDIHVAVPLQARREHRVAPHRVRLSRMQVGKSVSKPDTRAK
mgnify:CR=1 FL=1